jgi:hypothetical protein
MTQRQGVTGPLAIRDEMRGDDMRHEVIDAIRGLVTPIREDIELVERDHVFPDFERLETRKFHVEGELEGLADEDFSDDLEQEDHRLGNLMGEFDEVTQVLREIDTLLNRLDTMHLTEEDGE